MKINPTSLSVNQLLGATNEQYVIPAYQRRYSWQERQVVELIEDIEFLDDSDTHLLGSIVCLTGTYSPGVNRLELVDGQQRLTTISIIFECFRSYLRAEGRADEEADIARLLSARPIDGRSIRKVSLDTIDSEEFDDLVRNEVNRNYTNRNLVEAFEIVRDWISDLTTDEVSTFLYRLKNQAIVIRLDVSEAKDAFKLFETINNRGLRLSPTDIIKNFLLGNAARFGEKQLERARKAWAEVIRSLDGVNADAFFRYYITVLLQNRTTRRQVVQRFKEVFMQQVKEAASLPDRHLYMDEDDLLEEEEEEGAEPEEKIEAGLAQIGFSAFLTGLVRSAQVYAEIALAKTGDAKIDRRLKNLRMIKATQTYGLLMHLRVNGCSDKAFRRVLEMTESFVLRRHVCRERGNETEALFARLCAVDPKDPVPEVRKAYRELCPVDEKFANDFAVTEYTATVMGRARYILETVEMSLHGKHKELQVLDSSEVHIEHIIPQKIKTKKAKRKYGDWVSYLGKGSDEKHRRFVNRIGNMTLFSGDLNIGASNNPFGMKKLAYSKSSLKMTKALAKLRLFKFDSVERRSRSLAELAVSLWPIP